MCLFLLCINSKLVLYDHWNEDRTNVASNEQKEVLLCAGYPTSPLVVFLISYVFQWNTGIHGNAHSSKVPTIKLILYA